MFANFMPPRTYTGELFGVEFLRTQSGEIQEPKDIEREIDEAFDEDMDLDNEELFLQGDVDPTFALPSDPEATESEDSGAEVYI